MCRTVQLVYQLQSTSQLLAFAHGTLELCNVKRNLISQSLWEQRWHSSFAVALRLLVDLVWVMLIKTVCSSKGWRTNQECVPLPSFCHSTWTLKRSFSDRFSCPCFYATQLFELCWKTQKHSSALEPRLEQGSHQLSKVPSHASSCTPWLSYCQ